VIYKPLSVQSDWTDCNSHGTRRLKCGTAKTEPAVPAAPALAGVVQQHCSYIALTVNQEVRFWSASTAI